MRVDTLGHMARSGRQAQRGTIGQAQKLGRIIAAHRELRGWGKSELAAAIDRTPSWVSRVEDGVLGLSAFEYFRIARVLGISPEHIEVIAWQDVEVPPPPPASPDEAVVPTLRTPRKSDP